MRDRSGRVYTPEAVERSRKAALARQRAMKALAQENPERFTELLAVERVAVGLPRERKWVFS